MKVFSVRKGVFIVCAYTFLLISCGGGSGDQGGTGFVSLAITDAPIDDVSTVNVQFNGVHLKPAGGDEITITFDTPRDFDLLRLTGGLTAELLESTEVPVGSYNWIRLDVNAAFDNVFDSYADTPTGRLELRVPSGSQSGLKLVSGFTVTQGSATHIVIDWDLRQALTDPPGQQPGLHLRPALRVTDMAEYGTLQGMVDPSLVAEEKGCTSDLAADTGNAVYVYLPASDIPGDMGDAEYAPFITAPVTDDGNGNLTYAVHYLAVGEYSVSFTCQASDDDPEVDQDDLLLTKPQRLMIENGATTVMDFE